MRNVFLLPLTLALCLGCQTMRGPMNTAKGHLVVVGGGGTTDAVIARSLQLAGGAEARMLVVPQASSNPESGNESKKFWEEKGAKNVTVLDLADPKAAVEAVEKADFIWMPGGDQVRLMDALSKTDVPAAIRKRYEAGAVVGGTSAGAAVISTVMVLGGDKADLTSVKDGGTQTGPGLGLWPQVVVDQHFVKRQRFTRLLACVIDHPEIVGIGIDEKTSVIVSGDKFEVLGESTVIVVDARGATKRAAKPGDLLSASDLRLHVLRDGDKFDLAAKPK
jgi:cyanophycinase